jgi:hypothetical protein
MRSAQLIRATRWTTNDLRVVAAVTLSVTHVSNEHAFRSRRKPVPIAGRASMPP